MKEFSICSNKNTISSVFAYTAQKIIQIDNEIFQLVEETFNPTTYIV